MWWINLSSQPPCCASHILQTSQVHVNATLYARTVCRDAVCKILLGAGGGKDKRPVCAHLSRRTKRPGEVHSDEHAVQVQGEPQLSATQPGGEDPQDHRDQVHQSRLAILHGWSVVNSPGLQWWWSANGGAPLPADVEEKGVRMKLTVIDTPGFGDQINNENWWVEVL